MIFATTTASATSASEVVVAGMVILSALTFIATYLRASGNKSNIDLKDNTIATLKENLEAVTLDRDSWKEKAKKLEGQVDVLQEIKVTATPAIERLTKQTAKQHNELIRQISDLIKTVSKEKKQ